MQNSVTSSRIKELIKKCGILAPNLQDNVSLNDQGIGSLDKTNLFLHIEESYHIRINTDEFMNLDTIEKIVAHINEKLQ